MTRPQGWIPRGLGPRGGSLSLIWGHMGLRGHSASSCLLQLPAPGGTKQGAHTQILHLLPPKSPLSVPAASISLQQAGNTGWLWEFAATHLSSSAPSRAGGSVQGGEGPWHRVWGFSLAPCTPFPGEGDAASSACCPKDGCPIPPGCIQGVLSPSWAGSAWWRPLTSQRVHPIHPYPKSGFWGVSAATPAGGLCTRKAASPQAPQLSIPVHGCHGNEG